MRRCFIHAGYPKTGSTTIQAALFEGRESLLAQGLLVPRAGTFKKHVNHRPLVRDLCGASIAPVLEGAAEAFGEELASTPHEAVIISCENLNLHFKQGAPSPVVDYMTARGYAVSVVIYVRDQPAWIASNLAQDVKTFRTLDSPRDRLIRTVLSGELDYGRWPRIATANGLDVIARPYRGDVLADMWGVLGLEGAPPTVRRNSAPGSMEVAVARTLGERLAEFELTAVQCTQMGATLQRAMSEIAADPVYFPFSADEVAAIREFFRSSNEAFAQQMWASDWDASCDTSTPAQSPPPDKRMVVQHADRLWPMMLEIANDEKLIERTKWALIKKRRVSDPSGAFFARHQFP